ncbi:hypothetical protein LTR10_012683 [Elasticomyces elasticus]|uniref:Uncharacterized protein n=1 Tax=Exophiala sideris TaxID=1016849 RepID=A0ABR0JR94_9EURO|nr:hypothetical protein LTR10_012683 [Elasticomyces elasticus]KAK5034561.1 hypothetical protein LTR13_006216 [Exophiala sideris]KAK5040117.1 hypothetical protein LTS07_000614 [Exophiala sideris]KAK5068495.1 hypothetical protein LTR69_000615 [Exophiala sideris]KAK5187798.1 hypothetical protein LTR44_000616 [Eurotiomycetes sp. CCFEE 6388]
MPSQGSQKLARSPLCLPLSKFSYATVSNESIAPIPWLHISGKNRLFALFETSPTQMEGGRVEDRQKFKVLQDPEIMEELDLNALAAEAHRAMAQPTNMMTASVPDVTVIVKVPVIAMKYPMNNGQVMTQIRRFQIRFPSNEDYYEAMKMLSRANVPTVEAGSFPVHKPQTVPHTAPSNFLTPNDSASQIGSQEDPKPCDQTSAFPQVTASSTRFLQPASTTRPAMGPPAYRPSTMDAMQHRPPGDASTSGYFSTRQNLAPRSNVSLSTATTLVNSKVNSTIQGTSAEQNAYGNATNLQREVGHPGMNATGYQQSMTVPVDVQDLGLGLPPRRTLPFRKTDSTVDEHLTGAASSEATSINKKNELDHLPVDPREHDVGAEPVCSPQAKGKRKRAPVKSTTAKKPRATTTRKKAASKGAEDDKPVPTVEELLKQPGSTAFPRTMHQNMETKLLEISDSEPRSTRYAGATMPSPSLGSPSRRLTRSASRALVSVQDQSIAQTGTDTHNATAFPSTPADQMIVQSMPGSPEARHSRKDTSPQSRPPRSEQEIPPSSFACADLMPKQPQAEASVDQVTSAADGPVADLGFASSFEKLHAWASQPDGVRSAALKSYFCRLVMDESFGRVCKLLDSLWETEIMKTRLERMGEREE